MSLQVTDNNGTITTKTISIPLSTAGGGTTNKGTPGFEFVFFTGALAIALFLWTKKRNA